MLLHCLRSGYLFFFDLIMISFLNTLLMFQANSDPKITMLVRWVDSDSCGQRLFHLSYYLGDSTIEMVSKKHVLNSHQGLVKYIIVNYGSFTKAGVFISSTEQ